MRSLNQQWLLAFVLVLGCVVIFGWITQWFHGNLQGNVRETLHHVHPLSVAAYEMENNATKIGAEALRFYYTGDSQARAMVERDTRDFWRFFQRASQRARSDTVASLLAKTKQTFATYRALADTLMARRDSTEAGSPRLRTPPILARFIRLRERFDTLLDERLQATIRTMHQRSEQQIQADVQWVQLSLLTTLGGILLVAGGSFWWLNRRMRHALKQLGSGLDRLGSGTLSARITNSLDTPFDSIAAQINTMADRLEETSVSRNYLDTLIESMRETLCVVNREGTIQRVNDALCETLGYDREELVEEPVQRILPTLNEETSIDAFLDRLDKRGEIRREAQYRRSDGETLPILLTCAAMNDGKGDVFVCIGTDVSNLKETQQKLKRSNERFEEVGRNIREVLWMFNPDLSECHYINPRFEKLWGEPTEDLKQNPGLFMKKVHEDDRSALRDTIRRLRNGERVEQEYRVVPEDGTVRWVRAHSVPIHGEDGEVRRFTGSAIDITERKQLQQQLEHQALHDQLTDLPNRRLLKERLHAGLQRLLRRPHQNLGVFFLDLDRFKEINDVFGHSTGDDVLTEFARRLQNRFRPEDLVARFGGDEFVMVVEGLRDQDHALTLIDRLREMFERPIEVEDDEFTLSGSVGIVMVDGHELEEPQSMEEDVERILRDADIAMYQAKEEDTDYRFFSSEMHEQIRRLFGHRKSIARALESDGEFTLHFQPIVELQDNHRIVGAEALIRWDHPEEGLLQPGDFLPEVQRAGQLEALDQWAFEALCREVSRWDESIRSDLDWLSLNQCPNHFLKEGYPQRVKKLLEELHPGEPAVHLEILETTAMEYSEATRGNLFQLDQLGIQLVLDDFGTGYSSLQQLMDLPISGLKIDQSFTMNLEQRNGRRIVESAVQLGRNLEKHTIAEGVETEEQLAILQEIGCPAVQGFFFHRPMTSEALCELLTEGPPVHRE